MAKEQPKGVSLNPETYGEGTGLLDNVRVIFKEVMFGETDYNGKIDAPVPALKITMTPEEGDDVEQWFSVGNAKDWEASRDGSRLIAIGTAEVINKTSNVAILFRSILDAGFPTDRIEDDCSVFEGLDCHVIRIAAPARSGLNRTPRADGKKYEDKNLVVDKIYAMPGEDAGKGEGKAAADSGSGDSVLEGQAQEIIMDALTNEKLMKEAKYKDKVTGKQATVLAYTAMKGNPNRDAVIQLLITEEFLTADERPWTYDAKKKVFTLA